MTHTTNKAIKLSQPHRFCMAMAGGALLLGAAVAGAQRSPLVLNAAVSRTGLHPVALQRDPEPGVPEPPQASQPVKDDLFAGTEKFAKGASDVTEVTMDPDSLDLVGGADAHKAHRMILNVVRTYTYDKPGMYNPADVDEYRRKLESGDWHCSVHTRDLKSGESTDVCSRRRAPDMIENAIITASPKELTFIHNIRKANGQGGGLESGGYPGIGFIPGLLPGFTAQMIEPEVQAQMIASTATMRAQMEAQMAQFRANLPALQKQMKDFRFEFTPEQKRSIENLQKNMKDFKFEFTPEQKQSIESLKMQMNGLQAPAPPPVPPVPPAPGTPEAPAAPAPPPAPSAPDAPNAPNPPQAPAPPPPPAAPPAPSSPQA